MSVTSNLAITREPINRWALNEDAVSVRDEDWAEGVAHGQQGETTMPLTPESLFRQIQAVDQKHEDAHRRLRESLDDVVKHLDRLNHEQAETRTEFAEFKATPTDVTKLRFTPSVVLTVSAVCLSIAGGLWASTAGLRSDFRDMNTRMEARQQVEDSYRKLEDERAATFRDALEVVKRQQQLQQYETQAIKELVNSLKGKR